MNHTITVYSTPTCHFCHMAKDYFDENKIAYTDIDVSIEPSKRMEMIRLSGQMGVPVITIDDNVMVGFNKTQINDILGL